MTMSKSMTRPKHEKTAIMENKVDPFVFLPDDILSDILKKLPDVDLRYKAKYVCRRWFNIITKNILFDDASFILQKYSNGVTRIVGIREEEQQLGLEVQNLYIPYQQRIRSWYNESLLIIEESIEESLFVLNLITNKRLYLPPCYTSCCSPRFTDTCGVALCFDKFKGVFKVVHIFTGPPIQCHVLILGKEIDYDSRVITSNFWIKMEVGTEIENMQDCWKDLVNSVQVQGRYLHCDIHSSNYLVSVDMEKEKVFKMSLPGSPYRMRHVYSIFEMGGFLALIDGVLMGEADIWILKDFQRMEWEKLQTMIVPDCYYIENDLPVTCFLSPICGVIGKRYIIFMKYGSRMCCSYDLKNRVVKELNIHIEYGARYVVHSSVPSFSQVLGS